jgi:hypothetical protein
MPLSQSGQSNSGRSTGDTRNGTARGGGQLKKGANSQALAKPYNVSQVGRWKSVRTAESTDLRRTSH